jgi:hypothetical protein
VPRKQSTGWRPSYARSESKSTALSCKKLRCASKTTQSRIDLVASLYGSITDALEKLEARTKSLNERLKKVEGPR